MKVLFYVSYYRNVAGGQRSLLLLIKNLPTHVEPLVVFPGHGNGTEAFREAGIRTLVLPAGPRLGRYEQQLLRSSLMDRIATVAEGIRYAATFRKLLREERPSIAHFNDVRGLLILGAVARTMRIPTVLHVRGGALLEGRQLLRALTIMSVSHAICVADALRAELPTRIPSITIYNGVDVDALRSFRSDEVRQTSIESLIGERGFHRDRTTVLVTTSTIVPFKGLHRMMEALARLVAVDPSLRDSLVWLIVGKVDSPLERDYEATLALAAQAAGLDRNVFWVGWQPDAPSWTAASDIFVLPTVSRETLLLASGKTVNAVSTEGLPRSVLEAMAVGVPIIASDIAGVRELITNGSTGLIVPPGDPAAIAAAIGSLTKDPERARRIGMAAQETAGEFSIERMVKRTLDVYQTLSPAGKDS